MRSLGNVGRTKRIRVSGPMSEVIEFISFLAAIIYLLEVAYRKKKSKSAQISQCDRKLAVMP